MKKLNRVSLILIAILLLGLFFRIWRIDYPKNFVFDEVYYIFTAQEYLKVNSAAFEYWSSPPEGKAYAWVNPPFPQEIMAASIFIFNSKETWASRLPGVLLGILSIYLVFKITKLLFKKNSTALISSFIFSIDGLNFVQSRTAMLDIYLVAFILLSVFFFLKKNIFFSALFLGLAISSKWTAVYLLLVYLIFLIKNKKFLQVIYFLFIPFLMYLLVYAPFFLTGHTISQFIELLKQEIGYHLSLKATHDYASPWWSWPLNLYPVWYFVDYQTKLTANIFTSGNPLLFWAGSAAMIYSVLEAVLKKVQGLGWVVLIFFTLWLPWAPSTRIMFLYYFAPAVPFLCISLGYQLEKLYNKDNRLLAFVLVAFFISFLLMFPYLTGILLPNDWANFFFATNFTTNPF